MMGVFIKLSCFCVQRRTEQRWNERSYRWGYGLSTLSDIANSYI